MFSLFLGMVPGGSSQDAGTTTPKQARGDAYPYFNFSLAWATHYLHVSENNVNLYWGSSSFKWS